MERNITGIDDNGEEFEMDEEDYMKLMAQKRKEEEEERARNEEIRLEDNNFQNPADIN